MSHQPRSTWQPIGLATPLTPSHDPGAFVHDLSVARARRTARALITPGVVLAATLGVASTAVASGTMPTPTPAPSASASTTMSTTSTSTTPTMSTTSTTATPTTTSTTTASASGSGGLLGGISMPGSDLPVAGSFIANAPKIFSGGLLGGGEAVQTSVPRPTHTEGAPPQGGDACDFFLDHMWKNEDGIPVLGTNEHFLTYHTDAAYQNLPLSLVSGAIGNSDMPIIDIYGGPLGWIPIFNPKHVEGHGTDYVTMLTGCGGMGLPIDIKTGAVNLDRLPTPEKVIAFAKRVMPDVPNPQKILSPDYLYNTLAVDEITDRMSFKTLLDTDEYLNYATNNFDAFKLLAQSAFDPLSSGDPTAILNVLKITDNLKTLQSLGLPGLPGTGDSTLTSGLPTAGLLPTGDLAGGLPTSSIPTVGPLLSDVLGGTSAVAPGSGIPGTASNPGTTTPGTTTPGSTTPGSTTPGADSPTSGLPVIGGLLGGGSSPLDSITGILGGTSSKPTTPGSTTPGSTTPGSTTPGSTTPGSSSESPTSSLPLVGDLLGGSSPTGGIPVLGGLLGGSSSEPSTPSGSSTPGGTKPGSTTPGSTKPGGTTPGSTTPGSTTPGSTTPGSTTPGSTKPGSTTPGSTTPGSTTPGSTTPGSTPSSDDPASSLPVVGDLLGGVLGSKPGLAPTGSPTGSLPLSTLPVVGDLLGGQKQTTTPGGTTPGSTTPGSTTPGSTTPGSTTPGSTTPGSTTPGSTTPGSTTPGSTTPGSTTPGGNSPSDSPHGTVAFNLGGTKVNGQTSPTIPAGQKVTYTLPVTNTGDLPITTLVGKASDGGTMTGAKLPLAPGQTTTLTYTTTAKPGTQSVSFGIVGSNPNGQQQGKTCSAVYTGDVANGEIAKTGAIEVNDQPASDTTRYTFHTTDVSKLDVQVTNHGDAPLQNITATSPAGQVTGGKTTLQPGESTWFSVPVKPESGINTVPVNFTGTDPTGKVTTAQEKFEYTLCTCTSAPAPQA